MLLRAVCSIAALRSSDRPGQTSEKLDLQYQAFNMNETVSNNPLIVEPITADI